MEFYGTEYNIEEDDELERLMFEENGYCRILNEKLPVVFDPKKNREDKQKEHLEMCLKKTKDCLKYLYMKMINPDLSLEEIGELNKSIKIYENDLLEFENKLEELNNGF